MALPLLAAAIPIIARVGGMALARGVASGVVSEGAASTLGSVGRGLGTAVRAGNAVGMASPGGGNHGNEGETRKGNFAAGAAPQDPLSSSWLKAPQW